MYIPSAGQTLAVLMLGSAICPFFVCVRVKDGLTSLSFPIQNLRMNRSSERREVFDEIMARKTTTGMCEGRRVMVG